MEMFAVSYHWDGVGEGESQAESQGARYKGYLTESRAKNVFFYLLLYV